MSKHLNRGESKLLCTRKANTVVLHLHSSLPAPYRKLRLVDNSSDKYYSMEEPDNLKQLLDKEPDRSDTINTKKRIYLLHLCVYFRPKWRIFREYLRNLRSMQPHEARKSAKMIRFLHIAYQKDQNTIPDDTEAEQRPFTGD